MGKRQQIKHRKKNLIIKFGNFFIRKASRLKSRVADLGFEIMSDPVFKIWSNPDPV